ncbi:MAG: alpha-E domain-containing protein [Cytophagaceae bacterium]|jgi:uncharacterized alpha-E superfamily protein|nr:alpha-E domain-containing protein [Cytophagaceae bacterium]
MMLSRIANSLFWMGRYLERADHAARYIRVHYYSTLDAPLASKHDFIVDSIIAMMGMEVKKDKSFNEEKFNNLITLDEGNPVSIRSSVAYARENARGARDSMSGELWGAINRYYHFTNGYSEKDLIKNGIYGFCERVNEHASVVSAALENTLMHNAGWAIVKMGIHIERASQVARIMNTKVKDIKKLEKLKSNRSSESYEAVTMLKSAEAFDMSKMYYRTVPNLEEALEFLILNKEFPKSIAYNLRHIHHNLGKISPQKFHDSGSVEFEIGKLHTYYHYLTWEEVKEKNITEFLDETIRSVYKLARSLESTYMSY